MKLKPRYVIVALATVLNCFGTSGAFAEESTLLLDDFESHPDYLNQPWETLPDPPGLDYAIWSQPRVRYEATAGSRVVGGIADRWHEGAMRPLPITFSTTQSALIFQFEGRTTTNGEDYNLAGGSLSRLEFRDSTGQIAYFAFGLLQDHYAGGPSADPPILHVLDGDGVTHYGSSLSPEVWYEFRGLIDWTRVDAQNRHGVISLLYREVGSTTWITDANLANLPLKVSSPALATMLAIRVDQYGDFQYWHQGQMDNIRYKAPTTDTVIGFESSEGYTSGQAPPAPWQLSPENHNIVVTSDVRHGDQQSLVLNPVSNDRAVFPVSIPPGATASFSIWIRPGVHTANYETLGSVSVHELDTVSNYWDSTVTANFENNIDHSGSGGSTQFSLLCNRSGYFIDRSGDFTPGNWYQVRCSITATDIVFSVTLNTGTVVNTVPRLENYRIDQIILGGAYNPVYFDELIYSAPPVPVSLSVASAAGNPVPAVGLHTYLAGSSISASVEDVTDGQTRQACIGWNGSGSVPPTGTGKQTTFTLNSDSSLTWIWETQHWLEVSISGQGSLSHEDGFFAAGSTQTLVATPEAGWLFIGWTGDLAGTQPSKSLTITQPASVTAIFSDDADEDGLTNAEESGLGTDPWNPDTDGDGFPDKLEVDNGGSATVSDLWRLDYIRASSAAFDLYPADSLLDLRLGDLLIEVLDGQAHLQLHIMQSADLESWTEAGTPLQWQLPVDSGKGFFRLRAKP